MTACRPVTIHALYGFDIFARAGDERRVPRFRFSHIRLMSVGVRDRQGIKEGIVEL